MSFCLSVLAFSTKVAFIGTFLFYLAHLYPTSFICSVLVCLGARINKRNIPWIFSAGGTVALSCRAYVSSCFVSMLVVWRSRVQRLPALSSVPHQIPRTSILLSVTRKNSCMQQSFKQGYATKVSSLCVKKKILVLAQSKDPLKPAYLTDSAFFDSDPFVL